MATNVFANQDLREKFAKPTSMNARLKMLTVKTEELARIWSMATNVFADLDLMERTAKTTSTNVRSQNVSIVKMVEHVKI